MNDRNRPGGSLRNTQATLRGLREVAILLFAAALGTGCATSGDGDGVDPRSQPSFTTRRGVLDISVTEAGTIQPRERLVIKSEVEGRTTILRLVAEGTRVEPGDLLVELDASKLEDQKVDAQIRAQNAETAFIRAREDLEVVRNQAASDTEQAELDQSFAKQDLRKYVDGEFPQQVMEAEAEISLAEEELQRAEETLKWSRVLQGEKYLSSTELQADELAARKTQLDLKLARSELQLLRDYTYTRRLAELESAVKQAGMALERIRRKAAADVVQAEATLRAKRSEYQRELGKLEKLEKEIAKALILSPASGMVVYATSAEFRWRGNTDPLAEGQEVHQFQDLIYLPTTATFMAQVKVHESSLDKIALGLRARVTVDALADKVYRGEVARIAPLPDPQSMFLNPDLKVYNTDIHIEGEDLALRTGMTCRVEIAVARYEDAISVPVQAVTRVAGEHTVYVLQGEDWAPRRVRAGLDNNRMIHVIEGVGDEEVVLLTPPLAAAEVAKGAGAGPPVAPGARGASRPSDPASGSGAGTGARRP